VRRPAAAFGPVAASVVLGAAAVEVVVLAVGVVALAAEVAAVVGDQISGSSTTSSLSVA
jgi:hypothetical protein